MAKVLTIDDAKFMRRVIGRCITETGHEFLEAANGQEGLDKIRSESPDLVILDLVMPGMDGFAVLEALQKSGEHPPVIVMTADIQASVRAKVLELGAQVFLNKPPKDSELKQAIEEALALHKVVST